MGIVRLLLSLLVVCAHLEIGGLAGRGQAAVDSFFLMSGFVISLILTSDRYPSVRDYYWSRFLRVVPVYWAAAGLMLCLRLAEGVRLSEFAGLDAGTQWALATANFVLVGQDAAFFGSTDLGRFLLLPQAWTLAVEVVFYLSAPFVIRHRLLLGAIGIVSLALPYATDAAGVPAPWGYRFFPFHIGLFACGALVHQLVKPQVSAQLAAIAVAAVAVFVLVYPWIGFTGRMMLAIVAILLPALAAFRPRLDVVMGDLSYALFLIHWPVLLAMKRLMPDPLLAPMTIAASLAAAGALYLLVMRPVERLRRGLGRRAAPCEAPRPREQPGTATA
jgi:peptidoglycan/LPS O-acetylase OafA/YrhL